MCRDPMCRGIKSISILYSSVTGADSFPSFFLFPVCLFFFEQCHSSVLECMFIYRWFVCSGDRHWTEAGCRLCKWMMSPTIPSQMMMHLCITSLLAILLPHYSLTAAWNLLNESRWMLNASINKFPGFL